MHILFHINPQEQETFHCQQKKIQGPTNKKHDNYKCKEELAKVYRRSGVADDFVLLEDVLTLEDETTLSRNVEIRLPIDAVSY